jgi:pimeloyl-ACP methyl ester carboxylesterase
MQRHNDALALSRHTIEVDGLKQAYFVAGSGPVCVAHAGGPGINADYLRMPALDQHLTMVYVDPIGTGASSLLPDGKYFIPTYSRFLEAVLDHIAEPQTMVLGHSHGGMVALELAMSNPLAIGG